MQLRHVLRHRSFHSVDVAHNLDPFVMLLAKATYTLHVPLAFRPFAQTRQRHDLLVLLDKHRSITCARVTYVVPLYCGHAECPVLFNWIYILSSIGLHVSLRLVFREAELIVSLEANSCGRPTVVFSVVPSRQCLMDVEHGNPYIRIRNRENGAHLSTVQIEDASWTWTRFIVQMKLDQGIELVWLQHVDDYGRFDVPAEDNTR